MKEKIIKTTKDIEDAILKLSKKLNRDFSGQSVDIISMNHAARFLVEDLVELLNFDIKLQELHFKNYEVANTSGEVCITLDLKDPINDKHVILADGIIISGLTHSYISNYLNQRIPKSLSLVSIGVKPHSLTCKLPNSYSLFEFDDAWVEGYGIGEEEQGSKRYLVDLKKSI